MKKFSQFIAENYFYHHTKIEHLDSIKKNGLRPRIEKKEWLTKPPSEENHGLHFRDHEENHGDHGSVKLRVHSKHLKNITKNHSSGFRVNHSVSPEHVEHYDKGKWKKLNSK